MTDEQLIARVRNETTDNVAWLPDLKILEFAGADYGNVYGGLLDLNGVIADAWKYIARDYVYKSETIGNISVSQPIALSRAEYYSALSGRGGTIVVVGEMSRADLLVPASVSGSEFGGGDE